MDVVTVRGIAGSAEDGQRLGMLRPDLFCLDGYQFGSVFFDALGNRTAPLMVLDDNRETPLGDVDIVLNQNPHARPRTYDDLGGALCLLGLDYALVRDEIQVERACSRVDPVSLERTVLLSMGGADVGGLTCQLIESLLEGTGVRLGVVVGAANSRADRVRALIGRRSGRVTEVASEQMPAALARSSVAVVAAGTTLWEAAALGVPAVALIVADNQAALASTAAVHSFAVVLDARREFAVARVSAEVVRLVSDASIRGEMRKSGRDLVDGRGAHRVMTILERALGAKRGGPE